MEHLAKEFADRQRESIKVFEDISLTIEKGEFICFLGPSGCGKTTLLNILAGLETATSGTVTVDGTAVEGPHPSRGMVFQQYALFPWLTVRDNIGVGLKFQGMDKQVSKQIVQTLMEKMGLSEFGKAYPRELSGGMMQRVAIARAYAPDPGILLMDEPFGALDAQTKSILQEDLLRIWEESQKTVVFVTHDVDEAVFLASRIMVMSRRPGRIHCEFKIDLPHPRNRATRLSDAFIHYRTTIWDTVYQLMDS